MGRFIITSTFEEETSKMGKQYICSDCNKHLSSYHSHWRHKKTCKAKHVDSDNANSAMNETYNRSPLENVRKSNIVRRNHNLTSSSLEQNHDEESDEEIFKPLPKGDIRTHGATSKMMKLNRKKMKKRYLNLFQKMILLHTHGMMMDQRERITRFFYLRMYV